MFPLPITGPVLSSLETPSDIEKKEKPLSEDEILANKVDLDIAEALKEHEDVSKQVDADISLIEKPIEKDAFGEVKDPITKGIESVQSGISSIIGDDKQESPFVNELSERIRTAGPNKIDQYDKDIISTLNSKEQKDLLERHPWVYPTLTKDQKDEQFKLSRESNISALRATARAVGQVGNFGLDLVKAGWNLGLDSAYAEFAAPIKDAWTGETKIDPVSLKPISPRQQLAREKVNADLRNAAGAFMNTVIETQRQIEKYTGGTGTAFSGIVPTNASVLSQSIGGSPLFLATKLAEAGKNPDSGYAAFIDGLNEQFGFQDTSMSQKHYENRKLYEAEKSAEDWNAGQGSELVSPWSKAVYNPAFQFLNLQRESWMLPNVKTYAKLKGISEDQAEIELSQQAEANAETNLRDATLKWNKEYDPSMELLGGMFMGDAALDVAGIGVGGARLIGKGFKRFETAGMSPEAINALMTARQARQREILAENIANAQKRSIAGKVAKGTEEIQGKIYEKGSEFLAPIKAKYEKIPAPLRGLAQIGGLGTAGAYAGYILNPEDQEKGILKGLGTVAGTATVLGAVPGVVRSIDEARMLRAGGSQLGEGLLETAGKLPTSTTTTKILFGGKRGPVADYLADNFHTLGKAGINFAALNAINSSINSDSPEKFIDSIAEGFVMGAGFKLFGKIHGSDPEAELDARKRKDIEIYLSRQRQSDQTRENMDSLRNYQNYVDASQDNIGKMQVELEKAQQSNNPEKITTAQKAVDVAQEIHNQILSANVQTRNEMGRMMDEIYSDGNSLLNGARKVGQQNVQLEVLTTPQIIDLLSKQYPEKTADELTFMANQRGFFMPEKNASIVNFDKIIKRQYLFGESLTEAFRHELGHAAWSIKEFRDLNKTTDELLFDQVQRNLNGEILDIKPGKFSEDDLFELYSSKYLKNKTQEEIDQYAKESGLWDYNTNALNRPAVIDYMKDEVRAELVSGNLSQGYGKMKSQSRSIDDWVSLRNKTNLLARAMQNALGIGAKPFQSKLLGVKYDPEIVAANRKAIESLRKYNGEFEDAPESKKGQDIPEKVMRNDPVMRKRYGLNGGEYQTTLYAEVRDADGKVVGKRVPVTSENVKEGTWSNDATTGETKRTRGYGNVPEEFAQVEIPSGGSLNIVTDFAVESDGKTPIRRSDKDIEELNENRRIAIKEAIDLAGDRYTDPRWMKAYSEDGESYDGLFSPEQIRNIKNLPESVLPLSIKEKIIALNNIMLMNDGSTVEFDYAPRLKGKKYKGRRSEIYSLILGGKFHLSKATNFGVNAVSRGAWKRKLNARKDRMPNWFSPWGNDTGLFEKEMQEVYLQNTYDKKPGWYGLDPENPTEKTPLAEEKWNKFKDFLNMVSKDMPTPENPWRMKTPSAKGKEGKAQGDIDNLWRQFRLDAIADWADSTDATGRYKMGWENIYKQLLPIDESGEPIDSKTPDQQKRKGISTNFMPEAPIEATETERYPTSERGMYSGLQKTIDEKVQGKFASPDQLKAIVSNPQNAKAEELKWSGVLGEIDRLATENSGKVPKDKVMDYLRNEGAVKFEEVTLGGKEAFDQNRLNQLEAEYRNLKDHPIDDPSFGEDKYDELITLMNIRDQSTTDTLYSEAERVMALAQQAQRRGDKKTAEKYFRENELLNTRAEKLDLQGQGLANPPRFAGLQLPGGKNYREVVMAMPRKTLQPTDAEVKEYYGLLPRKEDLTGDELNRYNELLGKINASNKEVNNDVYYSSHFPDTPNYVAHMRLNERTDAQGNKGDFIEEFQSDRHQAGREKGYKGDKEIPDGYEIIDENQSARDAGYDVPSNATPRWTFKGPGISSRTYYSKQEAIDAAWQDNSTSGEASIPDAPFRKDWSIQLFKRALRDAVDADKKWIGWTTGDTQAERYDLSKQVDAIDYSIDEDGLYSASAIKGKNEVFSKEGMELSEVEATFGKELAQKMQENKGKKRETEDGDEYHSLSGLDLKVGGEGMRGFYDQILPKEVGKYVAKMGGKVEKVDSGIMQKGPDIDKGGYTIPSMIDTPIWKVSITPEMAGKVRGGQLQFMPAEQPTEYEPISARIRPLEGISAPTKVVGAKALSLGEIEPPVRGKAMLPDMELKLDISEKGIQSSDIITSAKPAPDAVIKPFSNALVSSAGLINFLPAWHGTPHEVDKFKLEKIGTGEGGQSYGWGLYFAQARQVGETYKKNLSGDVWRMKDSSGYLFGSPYLTKEEAMSDFNDVFKGRTDIQVVKVNENAKGNLYKVDLDVKDEDLLDWDKPLSEQSEKVKSLITKIADQLKDKEFRKNASKTQAILARKSYEVVENSGLVGDEDFQEQPMSVFYNDIAQELSKQLNTDEGNNVYTLPENTKATSEALLAEGIPGIRYLDGASRVIGEGTYNYVIFDENLITILDKNDKPVQGELPRATGLQFMPARPIGKTEPLPDFETTIIKGVTPAKGFKWDKATNVEIDIGGGRKMSFSYDPEYLEVPKFKDLIKELKGQPVILLEADRQRATGGDMGGPLHPFLKSNQVTITGPDGKKYKAVWANMTSTFVSGAKNRLASHGAKYALVHLMDPIAHKSNKRTARTLDRMMRKSKLSQREKEIISLSMQAGIIAGEKSAMSSAITALKRQIPSAKKDPEKIKIINEKINKITKEREDITPKGFYGEIFKAVSSIKKAISNVKTGNWAENSIEKANKKLEKYVNIKEYNELLKNNKSLYISDNIGNTFSDRGSAIGSILSFKFGKFDPSLVMRESSDFREGENLDIVTAVELSQNPDIFALYFGKDPKEEAAMSTAERKARDEMRANPDFVEHEAYDWVMLGPEKGNNFLVKNPVKPEQIFKKYRETHAGETVVDGSAETVAGAMRKNAGFILRVDEDTQKVLASKKKNK